MTSNRPYLIRALYEWLVDNDLTPYLLVDANRDSVHVPTRYVEEGRIVLNVSPSAVGTFRLVTIWLHSRPRFGGSAFAISLPPDAVLGVYARENGKGMLFPDEGVQEEPEPPQPDHPTPPPGRTALTEGRKVASASAVPAFERHHLVVAMLSLSASGGGSTIFSSGSGQAVVDGLEPGAEHQYVAGSPADALETEVETVHAADSQAGVGPADAHPYQCDRPVEKLQIAVSAVALYQAGGEFARARTIKPEQHYGASQQQ